MIPDLGKYAASVLSAYGVGVLLLAGIIVVTWLRARKIRRKLDAAEARRGNG